MAEVPIKQTLETLKTHQDFDETSTLAVMLAAVEELGDQSQVSDWDGQPSPHLEATNPDAEFFNLWKFPQDGLKAEPHDLAIRAFSLRFGHQVVSMSLLHEPEAPPVPTVGTRRLISYPILSLTVGHNPDPDRIIPANQFNQDELLARPGLLPPRKSLYVNISARDTLRATNLDPKAEPRIDEFAEIFFSIPATAGLYSAAHRETYDKIIAQEEFSQAA